MQYYKELLPDYGYKQAEEMKRAEKKSEIKEQTQV